MISRYTSYSFSRRPNNSPGKPAWLTTWRSAAKPRRLVSRPVPVWILTCSTSIREAQASPPGLGPRSRPPRLLRHIVPRCAIHGTRAGASWSVPFSSLMSSVRGWPPPVLLPLRRASPPIAFPIRRGTQGSSPRLVRNGYLVCVPSIRQGCRVLVWTFSGDSGVRWCVPRERSLCRLHLMSRVTLVSPFALLIRWSVAPLHACQEWPGRAPRLLASALRSMLSAVVFKSQCRQVLPPESRASLSCAAGPPSSRNPVPCSFPFSPLKPATAISPVLASELEHELRGYPLRDKANYILRGLRSGFRVDFLSSRASLKSASSNMASAALNPSVIDGYLQTELEKGRVAGPFPFPPYPDLHVSRFGVIPKKNQPGKWRLILDLSSPSGRSMNDGIPKDTSPFITWRSMT